MMPQQQPGATGKKCNQENWWVFRSGNWNVGFCHLSYQLHGLCTSIHITMCSSQYTHVSFLFMAFIFCSVSVLWVLVVWTSLSHWKVDYVVCYAHQANITLGTVGRVPVLYASHALKTSSLPYQTTWPLVKTVQVSSVIVQAEGS